MQKNELVIAGRVFKSRLMLGTGKYQTFEIMKDALERSGAEIITVAVRRIDLNNTKEKNLLDYIDTKKYFILPNTAGCATVDEAVRIARLAKASGLSNWIKLEVIMDPKYLLPDTLATIEATKILIKEGFVVLPYTTDDVSVAKALVSAGAATVMPGGSPIGSGQGIPNFSRVSVLKEFVSVPIVVDSGIGAPSDAAVAMESGADAVLINTAVALSQNPPIMADAFKNAVIAGRLGYLAGRIAVKQFASASSPTEGLVK